METPATFAFGALPSHLCLEVFPYIVPCDPSHLEVTLVLGSLP